MSNKILIPIFLSLIISACSGTVVMSPLDPAEISKNYESKTDTIGIIVYRAMPLIEVDKFIQVNVPVNPSTPSGPTILSGECKPVYTRKLISIADTQHPYRLHYDHGILEAYTFGATLTSDGILTVINSVSTPDQGKTLQNLSSAALSGGNLSVLKMVEGKKPDCTTTPVLVGYEHLPPSGEIKEFGSTPEP